MEENKLKEQLMAKDKEALVELLLQKMFDCKVIEQELAEYKELQDRLGLENVDEFEWFVMLDLLTDNEKNMHILDLHRELAELKEKAIVPKFKVGQEVWHIITAKPMKDFIVRNDMHQYELGISKFGVYEDFLFATEQEAQDKLKEIKGNE